ncbi:MAG TPA: lactate utilization protein C [Candidatus Acidoferrum sp.]|nr:lactate utilization protein C [Candidatus Acidoferrum sp.]
MTDRDSLEAREPGEARAAVLERIRAALIDRPVPVPIPRDYETAAPVSLDLAARFIERVDDYRASVERASAEELPRLIAAILTVHAARRIATPAGVPEGWFAATDAERVADAPPLSHAELDRLDGTITGCAVAIAETGTIVLDAGPDQGRRALSLLPDLHVCVVRLDQVVGTVPEALARLDPRRPQTWISGPSATSDIELQRVEGVHGPRRLAVILVEG